MYRVYTVKIKDALEKRSGTDGYQPKFLVDNGDSFLKVQCKLSGTYVNDWRVEDIASRICKNLDIYAVHQNPCRVNLDNAPNMLHGVYSNNFEKRGVQYISFEKLLLNNGIESISRKLEYINLSNLDKIRYIANIVNKCTKGEISVNQYMIYLVQCAFVDTLVCNVDRHFRNFGIAFNNQIGKFEIAPLFDFGMGLFENDPWFAKKSNYEECLRYCYIEPYSEDPYILIQDIKPIISKLGIIKSKEQFIIDKKLFPSIKAYEYYKDILKRVGV